MFECALLTRPDEIRVLHEPMGDAWYFGPEKQSKRYSDEECRNEFKQFEDSSYEKVSSPVTQTRLHFRKLGSGAFRGLVFFLPRWDNFVLSEGRR